MFSYLPGMVGWEIIGKSSVMMEFSGILILKQFGFNSILFLKVFQQ